jgi:hypothetical protein
MILDRTCRALLWLGSHSFPRSRPQPTLAFPVRQGHGPKATPSGDADPMLGTNYLHNNDNLARHQPMSMSRIELIPG